MSRLIVVALRKCAGKTRNIYRKIANNPVYAVRVTNAILQVDLNELSRLFKQATSGFDTFGANRIGFDVGFPAPSPADEIFNSTSLQGKNRLTTIKLRSISKQVLPLYLKISRDALFTTNLILAARAGNNVRLRRLIVPFIPGNRLAAVRGDRKSIVLEIKAAGSSVFVNHFFVL